MLLRAKNNSEQRCPILQYKYIIIYITISNIVDKNVNYYQKYCILKCNFVCKIYFSSFSTHE